MMKKGPQSLHRPTPPDGGWGWVVVFCGAMINALVMGQTMSFGIYLIDITTSLDVDVSRIAPIQGLNMALTFLTGMIDILYRRNKCVLASTYHYNI